MSDEIKFKCEECGKEFEPDPDTMLEVELISQHITEEQLEELKELVEQNPEEFKQLTDEGMPDIIKNISPEDRERLKNGESVPVGGICICKECQDKLLEEDEDAE